MIACFRSLYVNSVKEILPFSQKIFGQPGNADMRVIVKKLKKFKFTKNWRLIFLGAKAPLYLAKLIHSFSHSPKSLKFWNILHRWTEMVKNGPKNADVINERPLTRKSAFPGCPNIFWENGNISFTELTYSDLKQVIIFRASLPCSRSILASSSN